MAATRRIDINADAGEDYGAWVSQNLRGLFAHVTSVNLACGFHAGDPLTMQAAVRTAAAAGLGIGAHPSFPDLVGFGRRDMDMSADEVYTSVLYQLGALEAFLRVEGLAMHHVKPHGALYLKMATHAETADAVARAVADYDATLPLMVLAGEGGRPMQNAAQQHGLRALREAFPDRAYLPDGRLAGPRVPGAIIRDPETVARRALAIVQDGRVETLEGGLAEVEAETLCIHGDNAESIDIAAAVRAALQAAGVEVTPA
jgi:5-oxoprolinase (ATP-hydrolysing) subunit A